MKKIPIIMGVLALVLTLSACGTKNTDNLNGVDGNSSADNNAAVDTSQTDAPSDINNQVNANSINQTEPATSTDANVATGTVKTNSMDRTLKDQQDLFKDYSKAIIKTNQGNIEVKFYPESPITVNNFMNLAKSGFYNGTKFHRVMKDFMIQGGDPNSKDDDWTNDGMGGPAYKFNDEFNAHKLVKGSLAMANSGPNTNGSQFFIVTTESTPWLDGVHTNFGEVISGMDTVTKIENLPTNANDHPTTDATVTGVELVK